MMDSERILFTSRNSRMDRHDALQCCRTISHRHLLYKETKPLSLQIRNNSTWVPPCSTVVSQRTFSRKQRTANSKFLSDCESCITRGFTNACTYSYGASFFAREEANLVFHVSFLNFRTKRNAVSFFGAAPKRENRLIFRRRTRKSN